MNESSNLSELAAKLQGWVDALIVALPNIAAAVLIVLLSILLAKGLRRTVSHLLDRVSSHKQVNSLFSTLTYAAVVGAGLFVALGVLGLSKTVTTLLAGIGILGLALGFAFQDIAENFISGVIMAFRRPIQIGDLIQTNDFFGIVEEVNLRTTVLRTSDGKHVIVPNSDVIQNPLVNYTRTGELRVDLACGVAYGDDLEQAERLAVEAVEPVAGRDARRDVELFYESFGDSSIHFVIRFWIEYRTYADFLTARSEAIKRIKNAFDEHGITIPFPIRTLDFGVVGGVNLDEALGNKNANRDKERTD